MVVRRSHYISLSKRGMGYRASLTAQAYFPARYLEACGAPAQRIESYIAQIDNPNTRQRYLRSKKVLLEYFGDPRLTDLNAFSIDRFKDIRTGSGREGHPQEQIVSSPCCAAL
jgi:hypothetical protein